MASRSTVPTACWGLARRQSYCTRTAMPDDHSTMAPRGIPSLRQSGFRTSRLRRFAVPVFVTFVALGLTGLLALGIYSARAAAQRNSCRNRLYAIGLALSNYKDRYGAIPPAVITDSAGTPTHSWRTIISKEIFYDSNFFSQLDLSKPWNGTSNRKVLQKYVEAPQCPSHWREDSDVTQYVAVVGDGTCWTGPMECGEFAQRTERDMTSPMPRGSGSPKILIVDWPASDIEWTEPRDISVEQFLQWFRDRQEDRRTSHGDVVLYLGDDLKPHELRLDTDVSTVRRMLMKDTVDSPDS